MCFKPSQTSFMKEILCGISVLWIWSSKCPIELGHILKKPHLLTESLLAYFAYYLINCLELYLYLWMLYVWGGVSGVVSCTLGGNKKKSNKKKHFSPNKKKHFQYVWVQWKKFSWQAGMRARPVRRLCSSARMCVQFLRQPAVEMCTPLT